MDAYNCIRKGISVLVEAEPRLQDKPFLPKLEPSSGNVGEVEIWYLPTLSGLIHALRLHGYIASHPATIEFEKANSHFAKALMGDCHNVPKFVESCVSAFYEVFVFISIARTGITCDFIPISKQGKRPDIVLPKMQILVECKDVQGRDLSTWSMPNLGRRIREQHAQAIQQIEQYDPIGQYERLVFVDLPDGDASLAQTFSEQEILELHRQVLDAGESPSLDIQRARSLVLTTTGMYHLVEPVEGRRPIVVPKIHSPIMLPNSPMTALLFDALFLGSSRPVWASWKPALTAKLAFELSLPDAYKEAKKRGKAVDYLRDHF